MDKIKDFLTDFRNNWDNSYWWADHQWLMILLILSGVTVWTLGMEYAKLTMRAKIGE